MRAVRLRGRNGADDVVFETDVPEPVLEPGDALIRVLATGITPTEIGWAPTWERDGRPRARPIPGHELVGIVESAPEGAPVAVGDEVYGLIAFDRDGAAAERVAVRAADLAPKPASLDAVPAATLPLSALTAWQALAHHVGVEGGQTVLVQGAAGGVGLFGVQIARHLGARVIATALERDRDLLVGLGAEQVIDYETTKFEDELRAPVDVVLDTVGGDTLARSFPVVRAGGVIVTIPGPPPPGRAEEAGIRAVFFVVEPDRDDLLALAALVEQGAVHPLVTEAYDLTDGPSAYAAGLTRHNRGKLVLQVSRS